MIVEVLGSFVAGAACGVTALHVYVAWNTPMFDETDRTGHGVDAIAVDVEDMKPLAEFPIAGKPRRVPWAVKRREIEQQHRTKRKRMEEWT